MPPVTSSKNGGNHNAASAQDDTDSDTELVMADQEEVRDQNENTADDVDLSTDESDADGSESRRKEALEHMSRIEKEFAELKDRLYQEKMTSLKKEIEQVTSGLHPEFAEHLNALEKKKSEKMRVADLWRHYQMDCVENFYRAEREACEHEFLSEKQSIREQMLSGLHEKLKKLEEEKNTMDIAQELSFDSQNPPAPTRKLRRRGPDSIDSKATKKRVVAGPQIVYSLKEAEILEDLFMIRRGMPANPRRSAASKNGTGSS